jgi:tetratricopeptide (TPR) repeat protein
VEIRKELAIAYNALGLALESSNNPAALEYHRKALALGEALVAAEPGNRKLRRSLSITYINLGRALFLSGDFQGGLASNRKALAMCEALLAESPRNADYRRLLANTYQNDGDYRAVLPDVDGAFQSFRRKLSLDEKALAEDPLNAVARGDTAYTYERMADLLAASGNHGEALSYYRKALAVYEQLGAESSNDIGLRFRAILVHGGIGETQARLGERAAAVTESSRAIALLDRTAPHPPSGALSSLRGQVYMRVAAAYAALGASTKLGSAEKMEHWRTARDLYARSLEVWQDMQQNGVLTAEDATKPQDVARDIARCDAALRRLAG